jgi:hypothetical protein
VDWGLLQHFECYLQKFVVVNSQAMPQFKHTFFLIYLDPNFDRVCTLNHIDLKCFELTKFLSSEEIAVL